MSNQERIMLKVVADNIELGFFIVEKTTEFFQFMRAATMRANVAMDAMRFLYNGNIINAGDTPESLGMRNGHVLMMQMTDPTYFSAHD